MTDQFKFCGDCPHQRQHHQSGVGGCTLCGCWGFVGTDERTTALAGVSRPSDAAVVAAAIERSHWSDAMEDVLDDLTRRDQAAQRLMHVATDEGDKQRCRAKAQAYAHAAEMLRAAIKQAKEGP